MMDDKGINFPTFKERPEKVDVDMDILNDTIEYIRPLFKLMEEILNYLQLRMVLLI